MASRSLWFAGTEVARTVFPMDGRLAIGDAATAESQPMWSSNP